jgi:hypothetical protein
MDRTAKTAKHAKEKQEIITNEVGVVSEIATGQKSLRSHFSLPPLSRPAFDLLGVLASWRFNIS